ncbi:CPBP family intramembrane glutamic endopeptidase [[Eubacterium] cellulosolvens]
MPTRRPPSWKVFLFVLALVVPASYAIIPFSLTLTSTTLKPGELPGVIIGVLVNALINGGLAAIGLFLAARVGLGLPFVEGWLKKEPTWKPFRGVLVVSVVVGVVASLVILGLDIFVFGPPLAAELRRLGIVLPATIRPPAWQGLLASFSAGVNEEVTFRLFGVTLLAWLGSLVSRDGEGRPRRSVLWVAIIVIAVAFGLAHLPATVAIGLPLDALVVTRAIALNGIGGIAFGWLYWRRGLESAMVAHFSADLVLHVLLVLALRGW